MHEWPPRSVRTAIRLAATGKTKHKKTAKGAKTLTIQDLISYTVPYRRPRDSPMSDSDSSSAPLVDVVKLAASLQRFADDRDWQQFHSPKNLILALTGEVGELCEIFQWMSDADSISAATDPETGQAVKDELADVLMYLVRLSSVLGIDLNEAVTRKLASNGQKYPVDKAKSTSKKYDRL